MILSLSCDRWGAGQPCCSLRLSAFSLFLFIITLFFQHSSLSEKLPGIFLSLSVTRIICYASGHTAVKPIIRDSFFLCRKGRAKRNPSEEPCDELETGFRMNVLPLHHALAHEKRSAAALSLRVPFVRLTCACGTGAGRTGFDEIQDKLREALPVKFRRDYSLFVRSRPSSGFPWAPRV